MTTTERYELETRKRHLRLQAFDRAFIIPRCLGPGKVVDDPESEPAIRVAYKKLLARLGAEITAARLTERGATRADDKFTEAAMEDRKREGYF